MYNTLVVTDSEMELPGVDLKTIPFDQYLADYPKLGEPKTRIINLCDTELYLSRGYYCSLLAESRKHRALPSVNTINDLRQLEDADELKALWSSLAPLVLQEKPGDSLLIYFGQVEDPAYQAAGRFVFERFPAPILKINFPTDERNFSLEAISPNKLLEKELESFRLKLRTFTEKVWRSPKRRTFRWDMAILYDPDEKMAPSDTEAIQRFIRAAAKVGIEAECIRSCDRVNIAQYDALFIRETTSIDHPTYRLARKAEMEGLVVIDDPTSIMRCCNKIFLHDAFSYNKIDAPHTIVVADQSNTTLERIERDLSYPLILKLPESSFSSGVFKVDNRTELLAKLETMFEASSLALVQEYLYTDYDWRIGVLNGRAIYACKYFMARGHWQIYNHGTNQARNQTGGFETIATFEVPRAVLKAALKACSIIGNGLYGVDIKQQDARIYVIEVNDNPSIEHRVEDRYLGDELYMMIMQEFADRLERRGRN